MRDPLNRFIDASKSNYTESLFAAVEFDPTTRELIFITRAGHGSLLESRLLLTMQIDGRQPIDIRHDLN